MPARRVGVDGESFEVEGLSIGVAGASADRGLVPALERQGAKVMWAPTVADEDPTGRTGRDVDRLPEDPRPAGYLIRAAVATDLDAVVATGPAPARNLVSLAGDLGRDGDLTAVLRGPVTAAVVDSRSAAALEQARIPIGVMPHHPRIGALVQALASWARDRSNGGVPEHRSRRWPIELSPDARIARVGSRPVVFGELEFRVLAALVRRPGVACPHELLLREGWGDRAPDDPTVVKHHLWRIRHKLGSAGRTLRTVRGVGYRYAPQPRVDDPAASKP